MKLLRRLLVVALVYACWTTVANVVSNFAAHPLATFHELREAEAAGPRKLTKSKSRGRGHRHGIHCCVHNESRPKPSDSRALLDLPGKNPLVAYVSSDEWAKLISRSLAAGEARQIFDEVDLSEAERRFAEWISEHTYSRNEYIDPPSPWEVRLALQKNARELAGDDKRNQSNVLWRYSDLASSRTDIEVYRLRILISSLLMRGSDPRPDIARWVAEAKGTDIENLFHGLMRYRTLIDVFNEYHVHSRDEIREVLPPRALQQWQNIPRDFASKQQNHSQRYRGDVSGSGSGGNKNPPRNGSTAAPQESSLEARLPRAERSPDDGRPAAQTIAHRARVVLLADDCPNGWRGKLTVPYGEFSAVLSGRFVNNGIFHARDSGANQAAIYALHRAAADGRRITVYHGCRTKSQTVLVETPVDATIDLATEDTRCVDQRVVQRPFIPSSICIAGAQAAQAYEISSVVRAARR